MGDCLLSSFTLRFSYSMHSPFYCDVFSASFGDRLVFLMGWPGVVVVVVVMVGR